MQQGVTTPCLRGLLTVACSVHYAVLKITMSLSLLSQIRQLCLQCEDLLPHSSPGIVAGPATGPGRLSAAHCRCLTFPLTKASALRVARLPTCTTLLQPPSSSSRTGCLSWQRGRAQAVLCTARVYGLMRSLQPASRKSPDVQRTQAWTSLSTVGRQVKLQGCSGLRSGSRREVSLYLPLHERLGCRYTFV